MPDPTTTVQQMDLLRKEGVALVDDYRRALEGKLLSNQDPESVRAPYERRYTTWVRKVDALAKDLASDWGTLIKRSVRSEMDRLYTRAKNAYRARGKVEGKFASGYNKAVAQGLAKAPGQATDQLKKEISRAIDDMIVSQLRGQNGQPLPPSTRSQVTRALTQLVVQAPFTEKALLVVQDIVMDMGLWLERRIMIQGQIIETRDVVAKGGQTTPQEAAAGDQKVGALAKEAKEMDARIQERIEKKARKISTTFKFNPKLALDPQVKYLKALDARVGIVIRGDGVVVDLRGQIKVNSPLLDSRTVDANAQANVTLNNGNGVVDRFGVGVSSTGIGGPSSATSLSGSWTHSVGNNFSTGISAQRTWTGGKTQDQVRATLTWRF